MAQSFEKLKELNLSRDEVNRIGEALQKPEFRKLFTDYVEELQDPKNKQLYEEEVTQLEKERGVDVVFIHPNPGYVLKTSADGNQKAFINICVNDKIGRPNSSPSVKEGTKGLSWHLPHSLSPPRTDLDNKGIKCLVFDIVFHPDTLHLAKNNKHFQNMVNETALESVETNFNVKLDKTNLKFPKLAYKGNPRACVIRKTSENKPEHSPEEKELFDKIFTQIDENISSSIKKPKKLIARTTSNEDNNYTTPTYVIKHRSLVDIQEFVEHKNAKINSATPKELIVEVNLPLLKCSADIKLDVTEKTVQLISEKPSKYKLHLTLPYAVNEAAGNAKFEKDLKKLVITLPVQKISNVSDVFDSGVDSDHCSPGSPESEEERTEEQNTLICELRSNIESKKSSSEGNEKQNENNEKCVVINSSDFRTDFLHDNIHYNFPEFSCHVFENIIAFTLNVKNVDEKSVEKLYNDAGTSIHIKFTSIGSSFYPIHYAFFVQLPKHTINKEQTNTEVWDNNIILQVPVLNCDTSITSYLYGIDNVNVSEKYVEEPEIVHRVLEETPENVEKEIEQDNKVIKAKEKNEIKKPLESICSSSAPVYSNTSFYSNCLDKMSSRAIDIIGTSYESSGDELSCSSFSPRKSRSILKRYSMKSRSVGRSISESSLDDVTISSSTDNCYASVDSIIPEDREQDGVSHSLKKTVRFSEVIGRQLFRSNSSILGQKKKNQRKLLKKKRALERRHTQSEASESEEKKETDPNDYKKKDIEQNAQDDDEKREDLDIFHIDIDY